MDPNTLVSSLSTAWTTSSKVTVQMSIDPDGFVENVADKTGILDRRVKGDLKRFKEFIEGRGTETGAWRGDVDGPGQGA